MLNGAPAGRVAAAALVAYAVFLGWVVLNPSPAVASSVVHQVAERLVALGLGQTASTAARVEFVLNAAMFAPLTLLASWVWPTRAWTDWLSAAFLASLAVEVVQGLLLASRSAQFVDVVANTAGGALGAWLGAWAFGRLGPPQRADDEVV